MPLHKKKPRARSLRNVAAALPPARAARPRPPRPRGEPETASQRLAYTALGAAGTAVVGGFLARQNWQPKTIASVLAAVGGAMAWSGATPQLQALGAGTMAAGGSQLALLVLDDRYERAVQDLRAEQAKAPRPPERPAERRPANAALPPGALESAFERARTHLALSADDFADDLAS